MGPHVMTLPHISTRLRPLVAVTAGAAAATIALLVHKGYIDLEVYRFGAHAWLAGDEVYGGLPHTSFGIGLPFTYPPIAAIAFSPFLAISVTAGGTLLAAADLALIAVVIAVVLRRTGRDRWLWAVTLLPLAALLEPVRQTMTFGQINVLLLAAVTLDCLVRTPRWPRGVLVGLAAAVKLTPAAFVLFFVLRRDARAARTAVAAFLGATATGFLLAPNDSVRFWTDTLFDTGRIGAPHYAGNQSLLGMLARFGLTQPGRTMLWLLGVAAVLAVATVALRRVLAAGDVELAFGLNALAVLVISPISWSHHWVWAIPALLCVAFPVAATGTVLLLAAPQWWWFPETADAELEWGPGQQLLGSSYVLYGVFVLVWAAVRGRVSSAGPRTGPPPLPPLAGQTRQ
jgi:alpha-1,2-mannosyltransferase